MADAGDAEGGEYLHVDWIERVHVWHEVKLQLEAVATITLVQLLQKPASAVG